MNIYSFFEDFKELETENYRIERENPKQDAIFLRIYKKEKKTLSYLGITFIKPECFHTEINNQTQFFGDCKKSIIELHENPTLVPYLPFIKLLLTHYLIKQFFEFKKKELLNEKQNEYKNENYKKAL